MRQKKFLFKLIICIGVFLSATAFGAETEISAELAWCKKMGTDYKSAPSAVAVDSDSLYTFVGKTLVRLNRFTGEVSAQSDKETSYSAGYAIVPPTVSEDMIFMPLQKGVVAAFDKETLSLLWETPKKEGQTNCSVVYEDGKIFFGTWVAETKEGFFRCYSVDRAGCELLWEIGKQGGFYRTEAFIENGVAFFGSDDGCAENQQSESATLFGVEIKSGEIVFRKDGICGDIRSGIVKYDGGYVFSTKAGYVYNVKKDSVSRVYAGGACSVTPVVQSDTAYVGTGAKAVAVIDLQSMKLVKEIALPGKPNGALSLRNGYVFTTYNALPGGICVIENSAAKEIFTPTGEMSQYCISPIAFADDAMMYYKNDSGYIFALKPKISIKFSLPENEELYFIQNKRVEIFNGKKGENTVQAASFPAFLWHRNLQPVASKADI